jgi:hypothetical protein
LLCHTTRSGRHYDWLIAFGPDCGGPVSESAGLWTGRTQVPSGAWRAAGAFNLEVIEPHRRVYLQRQGPIGGGRGTVVRIDQGSARPLLWTHTRIALEVAMQQFRGRLELRRLDGARWRAEISGGP